MNAHSAATRSRRVRRRRKRTAQEVAAFCVFLLLLASPAWGITFLLCGNGPFGPRFTGYLIDLLFGLSLLPVLAIAGWLLGKRVDRRLEWFTANVPGVAAYSVRNQLGFRNALQELGVAGSHSINTAVLTANREGARIWTGYNPPSYVLSIPRNKIVDATLSDVYFAGVNRQDRGALLIDTPSGATVDLPLYFQGKGLRAFAFVPKDILMPSISGLRRALGMTAQPDAAE